MPKNIEPVMHERMSNASLCRDAEKFDLSKQGVRLEEHLDSLRLVSDRAAGRGDVLLIVPDSLWITPKTVAKSSIGPLVEGLAPWLQVSMPPSIIHVAAGGSRHAGGLFPHVCLACADCIIIC